jgi:NADH-quinone oxidoreductase subunit L
LTVEQVAIQQVDILAKLLGTAVLLPLISFWVILVLGPRLGKHGASSAYVATGAILAAFVLSVIALSIWLGRHAPQVAHHGAAHATEHGEAGHALEAEHHDGEHGSGEHATEEHDHDAPEGKAGVADHHEGQGESHGDDAHGAHVGVIPHVTGEWYTLAQFGKLRLSISYYIDALTIAMMCMVTLIATCIHFYSMGYMHDELHDFTDPEVTLSDGSPCTRPGRYPRFFQYLSLFCFSMLGLVVSGNIAMTFVFWELVGICSYFLIGFYIERNSASTAANKAFIVNRIGDFGMIIGLMILWGGLGTFAFGDVPGQELGLFSQIRPESAEFEQVVPDGLVQMGILSAADGAEEPKGGWGYWWLTLAGVGIFCGCVGKSAQFPLHTWLPDAMEGPTPVSALVHSATMVAAGVFLTARFYPVFTPEVLLVIACAGCITLFIGATIAITATDIKRVLAYSTISQLGYMITSLGLGGWLAGVLHLFTHAFFKSLLFMCSGSVIHAVHTNEMTEMGGLRKKMPWTAYTMLVGCLAIAGAGIPFVIGFSGYYSKDAILEQARLFGTVNPGFGSLFFYAAAGGAAITAFYMFRLWYMTFAGTPRDEHRYDHAHESPPVIFVPLVVLAVFAVGVAWGPREAILGAILAAVVFLVFAARSGITRRVQIAFAICAVVGVAGLIWTPFSNVTLSSLIEQARPSGTLAGGPAELISMSWPDEHDSHAPAIKIPVTLIAFSTALAGILLATIFYCWRWLDPGDVKAAFPRLYRFLLNKWWFDELYDVVFVRPTLVISGWIARFDIRWIDGFLHALANGVKRLAMFWEWFADRTIVDGFVNTLAAWTYSLGSSLRGLQTGSLRQYVLFIVVGMVTVFVLASFFWGYAFAG